MHWIHSIWDSLFIPQYFLLFFLSILQALHNSNITFSMIFFYFLHIFWISIRYSQHTIMANAISYILI